MFLQTFALWKKVWDSLTISSWNCCFNHDISHAGLLVVWVCYTQKRINFVRKISTGHNQVIIVFINGQIRGKNASLWMSSHILLKKKKTFETFWQNILKNYLLRCWELEFGLRKINIRCARKKKKNDYRNSFHLEKLLPEHQSLKSQIKEKQILLTYRVSQMVSVVKNLLPMQKMQEIQVRSQGQEDPLVEGMATYFSIVSRIPWTEEPGRLQSMGSQTVGHNWTSNTHTHMITWWLRQ